MLLLQNRLDAALIAIGTQIVREATRIHARLHAISENTGSNFLKLIIFFVSIPVFQLSHFAFKATYSLQQVKLLLVGRKCAALGGKDLSLKF